MADVTLRRPARPNRRVYERLPVPDPPDGTVDAGPAMATVTTAERSAASRPDETAAARASDHDPDRPDALRLAEKN
jgi:hypothetical protein